MLANYLIGLREGLEAALVVEHPRRLPGQDRPARPAAPLWAGVGVAVAVSLAFGAAAHRGPRGLTFEAQEAIGGTLSIVAVGFVTWMIFWMARAARAMGGELRGQIDKAADGTPVVLVLVASSPSVARAWRPRCSCGRPPRRHPRRRRRRRLDLGAPARRRPRPGDGRRPRLLIYRGAISINLSSFFAWTGGFLILVAAGVLSYGMHDLQEAGILPGQGSIAFDVSGAIDPGTWYGALLKGVFNFSPGHHLARGRRLAAVRRAGDDPVRPRRPPPPRPDPAGPGRQPRPASARADPAPAPDRTNREGLPTSCVFPCSRPSWRRGPGTRRLHPEHHRGHRDRGHRTVTVSSTDDGCELSSTEAPLGQAHLRRHQRRLEVTEFYLSPRTPTGSSARSRTSARTSPGSWSSAPPPGTYVDGVQAGHEGRRHPRRLHRHRLRRDGRRLGRRRSSWSSTPRTSTASSCSTSPTGSSPAPARSWRRTRRGDDRLARKLYPEVRTHWERIETVAESFGDLDPKMDAREADLESGQDWTGWHRIEKDLWPARAEHYTALTTRRAGRGRPALLADTRTLDGRIGRADFTVDQIANGSRGLMEEVATGKVTGEEEFWSHTDLWDFQANVDGAKQAFEVLEPVLERKDPALEETLDPRFAALQKLLDAQRDGDGFRSYDELSTAQVKRLADAVNALSEPLSHLTAAVVS